RGGGAEHLELLAPARLDHVARRIAAEDDALGRRAVADEREPPDLARGAAREAGEALDPDRHAERAPDERRETGCELSRRGRGTPPSRSRRDRPSATR